jgi:hypothetical protein
LLYGFGFGLFIAIMLDLNQYIFYPLPFSLVAKWALSGITEFTLIGLIAGSIHSSLIARCSLRLE